MCVIGIDPGQSGAAALIGDDRSIIDIMTFAAATPHDIAGAFAEWTDRGPLRAYIESVHSMTKQGVASSFKFGKHAGLLEGILVAMQIPYTLVTPQTWQKAMHCRSGGNKNVTKAAAQRLWPALKITHSMADAMLIAEYGRTREVV